MSSTDDFLGMRAGSGQWGRGISRKMGVYLLLRKSMNPATAWPRSLELALATLFKALEVYL